MSERPNMPPLAGPGADAHQIRRCIERAYSELDEARMRARRSGFGFIDGELTKVLGTLNHVRDHAEELRRKHTPPEHRRVGELHQAAHDAAHPAVTEAGLRRHRITARIEQLAEISRTHPNESVREEASNERHELEVQLLSLDLRNDMQSDIRTERPQETVR